MPNPGKPIVYYCRKDLKETLGTVSTHNGYLTDLTTQDDEPEGSVGKAFRCVVINSPIDLRTENFAQGHDEFVWNWTISVDVFKRQSDTDVDTGDLQLFVLADVVKALHEDRERSTYALDTRVTGMVPRADGGGIEISGFCEVRTLLGLPNEQ